MDILNPKYTAGPWKWHTFPSGHILCGRDGQHIAQECSLFPAQADGPLIAAAPELLEACKAAAEACWQSDDPIATARMCEAAIARAERGEQ